MSGTEDDEAYDADEPLPPNEWTVTVPMAEAGAAALLQARYDAIPAEDAARYVYRTMRDNEPLRWSLLRWAGHGALVYLAADLAMAFPRWAMIGALVAGVVYFGRLAWRNLRGRS